MKKQVNKHKLHIRKGDTVKVIAGDDYGKTGVVKSVSPEANKAVVEGLNLKTKAVKPSANMPEGGTIQIEAPMHISNLMLVDTKTGEATKVGRRVNPTSGKIERYSKKTGEVI